MIIQCALVDLLVVAALAHIEHALHEQADKADHNEHRDKGTTDENLDGHAGDYEAVLLTGALDDDGTEESADEATGTKIVKN